MKLIDMPDQYDGSRMRQFVRLLELQLDRLDRLIEEAGSGGGTGVALSDQNPSALGTAAPGSGTDASRYDHVHPMPSAGDVGADAAGTAASLLGTHIADSGDPHAAAGYVKAVDLVPYSISLIAAGETVTIPVGHNLLLIDEGLDLQGDLDLQGSMFSVAPNV